MNTARASGHELRASPSGRAAPLVFVVDGDDSVRQSLELLIQGAGWQPEVFAYAQEFLSRPRVLAPSCLILDVTLPDLNGLDLQKRIAAERTDMPIIFITAVPEETTRDKALKAGAVGFLSKPFREEWLISHLDVALKRDKPDCER